MNIVSDFETLEQLKAKGASLFLFGSQRCNVCQAIRPQLEQILGQQFERLGFVYIDCEKSPDICAQCGVFTLPVVQVYIEGMLVVEDARVFGMNDLIRKIQRPYTLWLGSGDTHPG